MGVGKGTQSRPGLAVKHATPRHDHGLPCRLQQSRSAREFKGVGRRPPKAQHFGLQKVVGAVKRLGLHILWQGQTHRPARRRVGHDLNGTRQRRQNLRGRGDAVKVTRDRAQAVVDTQVALREVFQLLQHRVGRARIEGVTGQQQHRQAVHMRQCRCCDQVGGPRTDGGGDSHDALAKVRFAERNGGMRHALFVVRPVGGQLGPAGPQRLAQTRHIAVTKNRKNTRAIRLHGAIGQFDAQHRQVSDQGLGQCESGGAHGFRPFRWRAVWAGRCHGCAKPRPRWPDWQPLLAPIRHR